MEQLVGTTRQPDKIMNLPLVLDRGSFKPLYYQISEVVRLLIESNELKPGDRLPSENELIAQYQISRNTARRAINALIVDGVAYTVQGKGTFVSPARTREGLLNLTSFSEEIRMRGMIPGSTLLSFGRVVAPLKINKALQIAPDQETFKIERLRLANNEPMALNVSYLPCHFCPQLENQDLVTGSLYTYLEEVLNLRIDYGERIIKAGAANEYESELLRTPIGFPVVITEGPSFLVDGTAVEFTKIVYRGDRYEFTFNVVRRHSMRDENFESYKVQA